MELVGEIPLISLSVGLRLINTWLYLLFEKPLIRLEPREPSIVSRLVALAAFTSRG